MTENPPIEVLQQPQQLMGHIVRGVVTDPVDGQPKPTCQAVVDVLKRLPYEQVAHVMQPLLDAEPIWAPASDELQCAVPDPNAGDGDDPDGTAPEGD